MTITPAMIRAAAEGLDLMAGTPRAIEASEKRGQGELVRSSNMPLELHASKWGEDGKAEFEAVGFTFGKKIDDVFQEATLPKGWRREASDHSMHSNILDEKGRKRVSVFYKAAFYDRRADAHLTRRFSVGNHYEGNECVGAAIMDGDKVIKLVRYDHGKTGRDRCEIEEGIVKALSAEFAAERPDYMSPLAYWDE